MLANPCLKLVLLLQEPGRRVGTRDRCGENSPPAIVMFKYQAPGRGKWAPWPEDAPAGPTCLLLDLTQHVKQGRLHSVAV